MIPLKNNNFNHIKQTCKYLHPRELLKFLRVPYDTFENKQLLSYENNLEFL